MIGNRALVSRSRAFSPFPDTHKRGSIMKKSCLLPAILLTLTVLLLAILGCTPEGSEEIEGCWEASLRRDGHDERYVYHITTSTWGKYTGSVQS